MKKNVVISGINLIDGGTLSIFKDYMDSLIAERIHEKYNIIALVARKDLFVEYEDQFVFYEFPKSKKSWFARIYYEYFYFKKFSKKIGVYLWFSMHDITPNVEADIRAVYCHNATIAFDMKLNEIKYDKKVFLFSKFYKFLYKINIKKNKYVIVQQNWFKDVFKEKYKIDTVISSRPNVKSDLPVMDFEKRTDDKIRFVYVSYPRFFKNFEVICKACELIDSDNFEVVITVDGTENLYAKELVERYSHIPNIKFVGLLPRQEVFQLYNNTDVLIFPSKLETWGLPITEFQHFNKPIIVADLPYAHETVGEYDYAIFFEHNNARKLADIMSQFIYNKKIQYDECVVKTLYDCNSWAELSKVLLEEEK